MTDLPRRSGGLGNDGSSMACRIRAAAMKCFAAHGSEATSLRMVAAEAGVSIGLVQHHFGGKAALVQAVDEELISILTMAAPLRMPLPDPVDDLGRRAASLIYDNPNAIDYLAHLLIENKPTGRRIFDELYRLGRAQRDYLCSNGLLESDADPTWGALNPLTLVLGTLIFRSHIERQIDDSLAAPIQLQEWQLAIRALLGGMQLA